jgi:hypothetical protein
VLVHVYEEEDLYQSSCDDSMLYTLELTSPRDGNVPFIETLEKALNLELFENTTSTANLLIAGL